jgi:BirA family biotin operon repressor/biotin-[acetyl-CoA-carboxylase] ligase
MASVYNDLDRPPLNEHSLQRSLMVPGGFVTALRVLPEVGSTNTALLAAAADGAPHGSVVISEAQSAGKGRLGRTWTAPARSGLFLSILLRPEAPQSRWGWLPLLAGVAVRSAVAKVAELDVALKWPNDLIVPGPQSAAPDAGYGAGRKLGGILCERGPAERTAGPGPVVVVGIGVNVTLRATELPAAHATSVALAGGSVTDRDTIARAILRDFGSWYTAWTGSDGDAEGSGLATAYQNACATIGRAVRAELPGGAVVSGQATSVDEAGRLVIRKDDGGLFAIGAGDVAHLR